MTNRTLLLSIERSSAAPNGVEEGAWWRLLDAESEEVLDPLNEVATAFAPSDSGVLNNKGTHKFNYNEVWDRSPFIAIEKQPLLSSERVFEGFFK